MASFSLTPPDPIPLRVDEPIAGTGATVLDFWRFALSDLKMNNARGYFAEFLVARAVGSTACRVEWDPYDVLAPDGTTIEVKSSAYLQAGGQARLSSIRFTGLKRAVLSPETNDYAPEQTYNADVYVFAIQTAMTHESYDPLDTRQWCFHVLPRREVEALGQSSIGWPTLHRLAGEPIAYPDLADAIHEAASSARPGTAVSEQ